MDRDHPIKENQNSISCFEKQDESQTTWLLKQTCSIHRGNTLDYLSIDSTQECVFKCMFCVTDEDVQQYSLIPIKQITAACNKTIFANFPLSDRTLTKEIKQIVMSPPTGESLKQDIEKFFKDLRANILAKLEVVQSKMEAKAQSISDFSSDIIQLYNSMSEKTKLQNILANTETPFETKVLEIKSICATVKSKESENKQIMQASLDRIKQLQETIDFDSPKQIKESILNQIDGIDMFVVEDMANFSEQLRQSNTSRNPYTNVKDLMKLVRNKLNGVSEESCNKFERQLNRLSSILNCLDVPKVSPIYEKLENLNITQTQGISNLINELTMLAEQEQVRGQESQQLSYMNPNEILELITNQANFCSREYVDDIKLVFQSIGGVLRLFRVRKLNPRSPEELSLNQLNPFQLNNICKLAQKINTLTSQHGNRYTSSKEPHVSSQGTSVLLLKKLFQHSNLNAHSEEYHSYQQSINQLLVDYPIFDLIPSSMFIEGFKLSTLFTKTNYSFSKNITIIQIPGQTHYSLSSSPGQVVSDALKNESGYLLKLKCNNRFGLKDGEITFGLIPNSVIDKNKILANSSESGFRSIVNSGATIVHKGVRLTEEQQMKDISSLEFRWCVSKRQFFISDQNNANINQVEEKHFDPSEQYRFGIGFYNFSKVEWNVTVTDFYEIDPDFVNNFNQQII